MFQASFFFRIPININIRSFSVQIGGFSKILYIDSMNIMAKLLISIRQTLAWVMWVTAHQNKLQFVIKIIEH